MKVKYDGGPARRRRRRAASLVIRYSLKALRSSLCHNTGYSAGARNVEARAKRALKLPSNFKKTHNKLSGWRLIDRFIKQPRLCAAIRLFVFLHNCKCHSLWELADFVSLPAMSGTEVVFVACIDVLFLI